MDAPLIWADLCSALCNDHPSGGRVLTAKVPGGVRQLLSSCTPSVTSSQAVARGPTTAARLVCCQWRAMGGADAGGHFWVDLGEPKGSRFLIPSEESPGTEMLASAHI